MIKIKFILLFLICLVFIKFSQAQFLPFYDDKTSADALKMMNLKGKVKSVRQTSFKAITNSGNIQKGEEGSVSDQVSSNSKFYFQFDGKSRAIKEVYFKGGVGGEDLVVNHKYDDTRNQEIIEQFYTQGNISVRDTFKYNSECKIKEVFHSQLFNHKSIIDYRFVYKYNEKGKLIEVDNYNTTHKPFLESKTIFKLDGSGNPISRETYNDVNKLWFLDNYKYDDQGNLIEHDYYGKDCKTPDHSFLFKYDKSDVVEKKYFLAMDKSEKIFSFKYEYDMEGNWIKRIDLEDGKAVFVLERKIEYFK